MDSRIGLPLDREVVQNKPVNLNNLVETLRSAFQLLEVINGKNVIICLGNSGCGKSTILNSIVYGSDSLKLEKIKIEVPKNNGQMK